MKYPRPCAGRVTRRVVRLRSDTPSFDSSTDNRRLAVEIGIPKERAARLMLSNWATLTNIRTSSRFAMGSLCHFRKLDSTVSHLIRRSAQFDNTPEETSDWNSKPTTTAERGDSYDYETEDHHCDGSLSGHWRRGYQPVPRSRLQRGGQLAKNHSSERAPALGQAGPRRRRHRFGLDGRIDRWYRGGAVRLGRCSGEQRRDLLCEALHRVHSRGLPRVVLHQFGWLYLYDTAGREADALAKARRQRGEHHELHRRSSACGSHRICANDHQGWYRRDLPEPCDGIRAAGYSRECGSSGRCRYAAAQEQSQGVLAHTVTSWAYFE